MQEKLDRLIGMVWMLIMMIGLVIIVNVIVGEKIENAIKIMSERVELSQLSITEINLKLQMFEEAEPPPVEIIYLDEDTEDWLNNDLVTGDE